MMPFEAGDKFCANCFMHSWKQPEDKNSLTKCPRCRMIEYCGEACRKEHRSKVHKNHCQFLADPTKCPQSQHDAETCAICRPAAGTGKGKQRMTGTVKKRDQGNSNYECFAKDMHFPPSLSSPHPFHVVGARDDLLEKSINVMQNLVYKFKQNPRVTMVCSTELEEMEKFLWSKRREIWCNRKVFSHPQNVFMHVLFWQTPDLADKVTAKVIQGKAGKDASELWKIIEVIHFIMEVIAVYRQLDALKDPVDTLPEQFRDLVKMSLDNKFEFLYVAEDIIDSLSTRVIPYEDIVKKLCGGKKRQNCSFCGAKIEVTEHYEIMINFDKKSSSILFDALSTRKYCCGSQKCFTKASSRHEDMLKLNMTLVAAVNERKGLRCDFCFQLCQIDTGHRCCNCLTVVYCSKSCHKEDKEKHKEKYCIEDERKTKEDRSKRRQMGEMALEKMAAISDDIGGNSGTMATVNEILEAFQFEDNKSKKQAEDNSGTEREHETIIPAASTVPTAEDARDAFDPENPHDRSGSGNKADSGPNVSEVD